MSAMTPADAAEMLIRTDPRFALQETEIRGVMYRTFANAPDNIRTMMQQSRPAHGTRTMLVHGTERWTFDAFCADVNRAAAMLSGTLGVMPGDRVAIVMRNYPELLILMMAIQSVGAIVVPVNGWWTVEELAYGFADSGARIAFADGPRHDRIATFAAGAGIRLIGVREAEATAQERYSVLMDGAADAGWPTVPIGPEDDFAIMYSSGSTGHPKGVVLTHRSSIAAVFSWIMGGEVARMLAPPGPAAPGQDIVDGTSATLVVTPLFHIMATHPIWLQSLVLGTKVVLMTKWDAAEAVRLVDAEKITRFGGVPTQCADLMEVARASGTDLPTLVSVVSGGAKRPPAQVAPLADTFPRAVIASGWGMTETNALGISIAGDDYLARPGAAGRAIPPVQDFLILDEDGSEMPVGTVGELAVKSPTNMRCYLNKPDATAEVLKDGWLRTGDLALLDQDGYFHIVDRKKNIIIRGGENIAALDVEAAIHRHPAVLEACVFSVPDQRLGEVVGAAVHPKPGQSVSAEALTAFLAEHLASFKIPEHLWFHAEPLPRGATDKLDRRGLRADCVATLTETAPG